jgi:hypothetical protein
VWNISSFPIHDKYLSFISIDKNTYLYYVTSKTKEAHAQT